MPRNMFQPEVCPPRQSAARRYTVPLSLTLHTALVAALILMPLVATDAVPVPPSVLAFLSQPPAPSVPPPPPPRSASPAGRRAPIANPDAAPVEAPRGVAPESGVTLDLNRFSTAGTITGVPDGLASGLDTSIVAPPAPEPAPPPPIDTGGQIRPPMRIAGAPPVYPAAARAARVEGDVFIEAVIGVDGRVQDMRLQRSIPLLDRAALDAVRSWLYTPTILNGQPVPVILTVTVRFRLN